MVVKSSTKTKTKPPLTLADQPVSLAIDAMGGDSGPHYQVAGALLALAADPSLSVTLVGDLDQIKARLAQHQLSHHYAERIHLLHSETWVRMDDAPSFALRQRKNSSMHLALRLVAEGQSAACVSAGNTGALMAIGRQVLGMLPGIERPAISTVIPTRHGVSYLLDIGANVDCQAEHLVQFALMGAVMVRCVDGLQQPSVALLNVGHESIKGNAQVKLAAQRLEQHSELNYQGYIEGHAIFSGDVQLVVCDGFVGNIALKTSEGLAGFLSEQIQQIFARNLYSRLVSVMARPILKHLKEQMDPVRHNGGSFLGLRGSLVKSHGNADARGFAFAIQRAAIEARQNLAQQLLKEFQ